MAFKLTFSDGQETDYDDGTQWEVENGVVKLGRESGKWTVFLSPSHWATLEIVAGKDGEGGEDREGGGDREGSEDEDQDGDDQAEHRDKDK